MLNKRSFLLIILLSVSLFSCDTSAMYYVKSIFNFFRERPSSRQTLYVAGIAAAGLAGFGVYNWFISRSQCLPQQENEYPDYSEQENLPQCQQLKVEPHKYSVKNQNKSIFVAASRGDSSAMEPFLRDKTSVNSRDPSGRTPLHRAVMANNIDTTTYLLERDADINAVDNDMRTPLHFASSINMIRLLMSYKPEIKQNKSGSTIFHIAARKPDLMNALISQCERKVLLQYVVLLYDEHGYNPLIYSLQSNNIEYVRNLFNCFSANIIQRCTSRYTGRCNGDNLLHLAVLSMNHELVKMLIEEFGFLQIIDNKNKTTGETALHLALREGCFDSAQYLINRGARYDIQNKEGKTARNIDGWASLTLPDATANSQNHT